MNLTEILKGLDAEDDGNWTADGQVRLDVLGELLGEKVTRAQVKEIAPKFCKANPLIELPEPEPEQDVVNPWDGQDDEPEELGEGGLADGSDADEPEETNQELNEVPVSDLEVLRDKLVKATLLKEKANNNWLVAQVAYDEAAAKVEQVEKPVFNDLVTKLAKARRKSQIAAQERRRKLSTVLTPEEQKVLLGGGKK